MHHTLLTDIALILGISLGVLWVCHRLGVPAILGFLLTGALAGPHGLALVQSVEEVDVLAEIGVVLLLFTIGLEFPLSTLLKRKRILFVGGGGQVLATAAVAFVAAVGLGTSVRVAVLWGFVAALSSTAVVLSSLQRTGALDQASGRATLGILIFQDLAIVPMMALLPLLAPSAADEGSAVVLSMVRALGILVLVLLAARQIIPSILARVVSTRSRELFLLAVVTICLAVAWVASWAGLSLALGAFLAGLLVSESEYSHQALGVVIPLRDVFAAFFFVSIGMLFDPGLVGAAPVNVAAGVAAVVLGKAAIATAVGVVLGLPLATSVLVGLSLAQIGEFSFVMARAGLQQGILLESQYQWLLAVAVLSMATTPILISLGPRLARVIEALRLPAWLVPTTEDLDGSDGEHATLAGHLVIVGFGTTGRTVARSAALAGIPYRAVEMNPETVREARDQGEPIIWGDGSMDPVLERVGAAEARVVVVAIPDAAATRMVTGAVRRMNPGARIVVRTRLLEEIDELARLGADNVIPQEWETAVHIVEEVLGALLIPRHEIESFLHTLRSSQYEVLRSGGPPGELWDGRLGGAEIVTLEIREGSTLAGHTLRESSLRRLYGVSVLAIRRGETFISNPRADERLEASDQVVVLGLPEEISTARLLFQALAATAPSTDTADDSGVPG